MPACPVVAPLDVDVAEAVVSPYFKAVKEVFVRAGALLTKRVRLEIAEWAHDKPRHFAATDESGRLVVVAPEFANLPEGTILAILAHEFGHAVDFLYPARFLLVDDGELIEMPEVPPEGELIDSKAEQASIARSRAWRRRDKDLVERTADAIAEHFTGLTIGYCGPCELQCFNRGRRPRRSGLR
jgi:hypothetical protein